MLGQDECLVSILPLRLFTTPWLIPLRCVQGLSGAVVTHGVDCGVSVK